MKQTNYGMKNYVAENFQGLMMDYGAEESIA
jgi:hypothetical protein